MSVSARPSAVRITLTVGPGVTARVEVATRVRAAGAAAVVGAVWRSTAVRAAVVGTRRRCAVARRVSAGGRSGSGRMGPASLLCKRHATEYHDQRCDEELFHQNLLVHLKLSLSPCEL